MNHLKLVPWSVFLSLAASAAAGSAPNCTIKCLDRNDQSIREQVSNSFDECMEFASGSCESVSFSYRGDEKSHKVFVKELTGKISFKASGAKVKLKNSELGGDLPKPIETQLTTSSSGGSNMADAVKLATMLRGFGQ